MNIMSIEKRIDKLEKSTHREGGHETQIKYRDGNVTHFRRGDGPPWETTIISPAYEMNEEQRKKFDEMMLSVFNGKRTERHSVGESEKGKKLIERVGERTGRLV
jgi:hypothetical protein